MKQLIWDLPTRFFHWLLAGSVLAAFALAQLAEKETPLFYLHVVFAVLAALLLLWRIVWGLIGSRHARWSELVVSPKSVSDYFSQVLNGKGTFYAGHNPGGSVVIIGILGLLALTIFTGLMSAQAEIFEEMHESLPVALMVLVGFHVAGVILATKMHGENYVLAMFTGYKKGEPKDAIAHSHPVASVFMLVFVLGSWYYFIKGFDRNKALFTAPGTQWSFQVGEPEAGEGSEGAEGKLVPSGTLRDEDGDDD